MEDEVVAISNLIYEIAITLMIVKGIVIGAMRRVLEVWSWMGPCRPCP